MIGIVSPLVRADMAKEAAVSLLKEHDIQDPPVPVKKIIKKEGWRLFYFYNSQCADFANEEGFARLEGGIYCLYLNAELPAGRDNFTYAHETAHITLKHHTLYDIDNLTEHENWLLDREANIFAANLLMAEEWMLSRINSRKILQVSDIYNLKAQFGVSWEAMINRLDELSIQSKTVTHDIFNERKRLLQKDGLIIDVDESLKYLSCPGCGSKDISSSASYCKICGTYLYNNCTNLGCQTHNAPDARYCERCGAETVLFQAGLLTARPPGGKRKTPELRIIGNGTARKGGFSV